MILIFALSVMSIQGFRHSDHDNKPMGADDWSSELGDFGGLISSWNWNDNWLLGSWKNDIDRINWYLKEMKDDEVHAIDEEFDTAVLLLDRLATKVSEFRKKFWWLTRSPQKVIFFCHRMTGSSSRSCCFMSFYILLMYWSLEIVK